ncbi:MAG: hypothetical protein Q4G09_02355 [Clostridia bacterium]|nr:hypothetical protein [Clostridia bacterium]
MLHLDSCIYLGNDLNDSSMFSQALDDNDFIVIANNEHENVTNMLVEFLKSECKIKGINWDETKLLVLKQSNVNQFLNRMTRILKQVNSEKKFPNPLVKPVAELNLPKLDTKPKGLNKKQHLR